MLEKESEMLEAKEEKEMELEMKHCQPEKEEGEDEAVYSTVNDPSYSTVTMSFFFK